MHKEIVIDPFDSQSIQRAYDEIQRYKTWFKQKVTLLQTRLTNELNTQVQANFSSAWYDDDIHSGTQSMQGQVRIQVEKNGGTTVIYALGEEAIFVEFGAGVYYNGRPGGYAHPKAEEAGAYAIGTYGLGNGMKNKWAYLDGNGQVHWTHGTAAQMPMYRAMLWLKDNYVRIAREVFQE